MEANSSEMKLGVIICKYCNSIIDTVDTEKVITYYLECGEEDCMEHTVKHRGKEDDC
ncbi:hypothetical protein D3C73_553970 [compost metagenome]